MYGQFAVLWELFTLFLNKLDNNFLMLIQISITLYNYSLNLKGIKDDRLHFL